MMNSAPSSGRKIVTERIGQLVILLPPAGKHEPGDETGDADQHHKRVVVHVASLQAHHVAGHVQYPIRHAVRAETVDQPAVAALPQQAAEPYGWPHEDGVVDFVEVPLVQEEAVKHAMLAG